MGTKANPGSYDCYSKAEPDEPMFVLLGRDPVAAAAVWLWIQIRKEMGTTEEPMLDEARACMRALTKWARSHGKEEQAQAMLHALKKLFERSGGSLFRLIPETNLEDMKLTEPDRPGGEE